MCDFSEERTVARWVLAAMGKEGWVGDSRYVEKENAEVVGSVKGKGMFAFFAAQCLMCSSGEMVLM